MKAITLFIIFILMGMFIIVTAWVFVEFSYKHFNEKYLLLRSLISDCKVTQENYDAIRKEFNEIYCTTDAEKDAVKKLWFDFEYRFKNISIYKL